MVAVGGIHRVLILVGVVLTAEEAGLHAQLQSPVALTAQRHHIAEAQAGAGALAYPTAVLVEADAEDGGMGVGLQVEAGIGFAVVLPIGLVDLIGLIGSCGLMGTFQIVAALHLVVAELEVFVGPIVLIPRHVERRAPGEVALLRIILDGHIGDGCPAVVARDIGAIQQQVGLDGQQLTALEHLFTIDGVLRLYEDGSGLRLFCRLCDLWLWLDDGFGLGLFVLAEEQHDAGGTQLREVFAVESLPQLSLAGFHELLLQLLYLVGRQIFVAQALDKAVVRIAGILHGNAEQAVVLDDTVLTQVAVHIRRIVQRTKLQTRRHKVGQRLGTTLAQRLVQPVRTFGRGGTANNDGHELQTVLIDARQHDVLQLLQRLVVFGQAVLVDAEQHLAAMAVEVLVRQMKRVFAVKNPVVAYFLVVIVVELKNQLARQGLTGRAKQQDQQHQKASDTAKAVPENGAICCCQMLHS